MFQNYRGNKYTFILLFNVCYHYCLPLLEPLFQNYRNRVATLLQYSFLILFGQSLVVVELVGKTLDSTVISLM